MTTQDILNKFQEKVIEIHKEASNNLKSLNKRQKERYAWAERAKQIAMIEMQSLINELKSELDEPIEEVNRYKELYHDLTDWMIENKLTSDNVVWKKIVELEKSYNEAATSTRLGS